MKKLIFILTIILLLFTSCSKEEQSYFSNELDYYLLLFDGEMAEVRKLIYVEIHYTDGSYISDNFMTDMDGKITLVFEEDKELDWFYIRTDYNSGVISNKRVLFSFWETDFNFLNKQFTPNSDNKWGIYLDTHSIIVIVDVEAPECYTTWKGSDIAEPYYTNYILFTFFSDGSWWW